MSLTNNIRYVADRMYDTIETTSIIDGLSHPYNFSIFIMCSDILSLSLVFIDRTGRQNKDECQNRPRDET